MFSQKISCWRTAYNKFYLLKPPIVFVILSVYLFILFSTWFFQRALLNWICIFISQSNQVENNCKYTNKFREKNGGFRIKKWLLESSKQDNIIYEIFNIRKEIKKVVSQKQNPEVAKVRKRECSYRKKKNKNPLCFPCRLPLWRYFSQISNSL